MAADTPSEAASTRAIADPAAPLGNGAAGTPQSPQPAPHRHDVLLAALIMILVLAGCLFAYVAATVPAAWFPRASPITWSPKNLVVARGTGRIVGDELVVAAPDASGITLITVTTDFRSSDYAGIAWIVAGIGEDADARLLWHTDVQPDKLNTAPLRTESGRSLPVVMVRHAAWIGRVTGLALAIRGPLPQPIRLRGIVAKPMGAVETIRDRVGEWLAFEPWNGASINTIEGGAENQDVPLPAVLALAIGLGALCVIAIRHWRPDAFSAATPVLLAGFFLAGWLVLDARWTWNLLRQERATAAQYGGKDARDKHLASDDGPLFAFVEKARAVLPRTPVRIFVVADADYFRGRAAYHLYPHSVYFDPRSNELPRSQELHAGDWLLVYQRRGIQFDRTLGKIRWTDGQTLNADLTLVEPGAALFVIR